MFSGCNSLVGGNGTAFDASRTNAEYARIDAPDSPGYFTYKEPSVKARFKPSKNGNAFIHNNEAGDGFEGIKKHSLARQYKKSLLSGAGVTSNDVCSVSDKASSKWEGSCHGIAATMLLLYNGDIGISSLRAAGSGAKNYAGLARPCDNTKLLNAIEYYQLSQFVGAYEDKVVSKVYPSSWETYIEGGDRLSTLLRLMYAHVASDSAVCLSFGVGGHGHSVLVTDVSQDSEGYLFKFYDCNGATATAPGKLRDMRVSSGFDAFSFTDANSDAVNQGNFTYLELRSASGFSALGAGVKGLSTQSVRAQDEGRIMLRFKGDCPVMVTDVRGRTLSLGADGRLSGTIGVFGVDFAEDGGSYDLTAWTDAVGPVAVAPASEGGQDVCLAVGGADGYASVDARGATGAVVDASGDVAIDADGACDYRVFASLNDAEEYSDMLMASCEGEAQGDVTATRSGESLIVESEGAMEGVTAAGYLGSAAEEAELGNIPAGERVASPVPDAEPTAIGQAEISFPEGGFSYTGEPVEPAVEVTLGEEGLVAGMDYDVAYADNTDAGTARVTVAGKGDFAGTASATFQIARAPIAGAKVALAKGTYTYTGSQVKSAVKSVSLGGRALSAGADYSVSYSSNKNAGTAKVTVTGEGNYAGAATATFKIAPASIAKASVAGVAARTYTGKALSQSPTVKLGSKTLKKGADYTLSYGNNRNVGSATVTVEGKGNYTGSVSKAFKVNPKPTAVSKLTAASRGFTATWKRQSAQATGYQLQWCASKAFKSGVKSATVAKASTTSKKVAKLKAKKRYWVRVRTYKAVGKARYYSSWSAPKAVTTKK